MFHSQNDSSNDNTIVAIVYSIVDASLSMVLRCKVKIQIELKLKIYKINNLDGAIQCNRY